LGEAVISRLREVYGADNDSDLASKMDVAKSTISSWHDRGVPNKICVRVARERAIRLDWLLEGSGPARPPTEPSAKRLREATDAVLDAVHESGISPSPGWVFLLQELVVTYGMKPEGVEKIVQQIKKEEGSTKKEGSS
jgi:hypothetical protein